MPSLLITIVFLQVIIHLFNTIGVSALNTFVSLAIYSRNEFDAV